MNNRQLRNWVFILYPDNPKHLKALDILHLMPNSLYIKHIAKTDEEGDQQNKEHYHCLLRYDNGYWLSKLLKDLGLDDEDEHLFHSYRDFKKGSSYRFKTLNDYVLYLDHMDDETKEDKYSPDDFMGGLRSWALEVLASRDKESYELFFDMCDFIRQYNLEHFMDIRNYTFNDWFRICIDHGYGKLFYNNWFKMRDILRPYMYY